jgi:hypothetical protein
VMQPVGGIQMPVAGIRLVSGYGSTVHVTTSELTAIWQLTSMLTVAGLETTELGLNNGYLAPFRKKVPCTKMAKGTVYLKNI